MPCPISDLIPLGQRAELHCNGRKNGEACPRHELIEPEVLLEAIGPSATFVDANRRLRCTWCGEREIRIRACIVDHYEMSDALRNASNMGGLEADLFPKSMKVPIGAIAGRGWPITLRCDCGAAQVAEVGAVVRQLRGYGGGYQTPIDSAGAAWSTPCARCGATTWSSSVERDEVT